MATKSSKTSLSSEAAVNPVSKMVILLTEDLSWTPQCKFNLSRGTTKSRMKSELMMTTLMPSVIRILIGQIITTIVEKDAPSKGLFKGRGLMTVLLKRNKVVRTTEGLEGMILSIWKVATLVPYLMLPDQIFATVKRMSRTILTPIKTLMSLLKRNKVTTRENPSNFRTLELVKTTSKIGRTLRLSWLKDNTLQRRKTERFLILRTYMVTFMRLKRSFQFGLMRPDS